MDNLEQKQARDKSDFLLSQMDFSFLPLTMQEKSIYAIASKCYNLFLLLNDYDTNYEFHNANPSMLVNPYEPSIIVGNASILDMVKQSFVNLCKKNLSLYTNLNHREEKNIHIFNDGKIYFENANDYARRHWRQYSNVNNSIEQYLNHDSKFLDNEFLHNCTLEELIEQLKIEPKALSYQNLAKENLLMLLVKIPTDRHYSSLNNTKEATKKNYFNKIEYLISIGMNPYEYNVWGKNVFDNCHIEDRSIIEKHILEQLLDSNGSDKKNKIKI